LDSFDVAVLVRLLRENPSRSLASYQRELFHQTGTIASKSTLSRLWKNGFEIAATLRQPNLVPIDKYKPENIERAVEYIQTIISIHLLWLPTRSPELNPIELLWNILVQRLRTVDLFSQAPARHRVAYHTFDILRAITTQEVLACYRKCGYSV
jgi:transposase